MNQGDALEHASPVTDVVVERNEDFYDQSYVEEKENTGTEVSFITATMFQQSSSSLRSRQQTQTSPFIHLNNSRTHMNTRKIMFTETDIN